MTVRMIVGVAGMIVVVHQSIFYDMEMTRTLVGRPREVNAASVIGMWRLGWIVGQFDTMGLRSD